MVRKQKKINQQTITWDQFIKRRGIKFNKAWCSNQGIKSYMHLCGWCESRYVTAPAFHEVADVFELLSAEVSAAIELEGHVTDVDDREVEAHNMINDLIDNAAIAGRELATDAGEVFEYTKWVDEMVNLPISEPGTEAHEIESTILDIATHSARLVNAGDVPLPAGQYVIITKDTGDYPITIEPHLISTLQRREDQTIIPDPSAKPKRSRTKITEPKSR